LPSLSIAPTITRTPSPKTIDIGPGVVSPLDDLLDQIMNNTSSDQVVPPSSSMNAPSTSDEVSNGVVLCNTLIIGGMLNVIHSVFLLLLE
jgi:hypothetical protein